MKIKALYDSHLKHLEIPVVLKTPTKRIISKFIFDTGSPHTILNYSDSIRLGVPQATKSEIVGLGGRKYHSYTFHKFEIVFKSEDHKEIKEIIPIRILKPTSFNMESVEELDFFPNILGMDFLEKGYKFLCDLQTKEIYFEKTE